MSGEFWLSDRQWAAIETLLPKNQLGARRVDDRRVISGIVHVLKVGCRWQDCPGIYGPPTTIYNRFHRWAGRGLWQRMFYRRVSVRTFKGRSGTLIEHGNNPETGFHVSVRYSNRHCRRRPPR